MKACIWLLGTSSIATGDLHFAKLCYQFAVTGINLQRCLKLDIAKLLHRWQRWLKIEIEAGKDECEACTSDDEKPAE